VLAQTIFLLAVAALLATSAVAGVAGVARAQTANAARALIVPGVESALARYEAFIAATIAAQMPPPDGAFAAPPAPVPALNGAAPWSAQTYQDAPPDAAPLQITTSVVPTTLSVPACGAGEGGPDMAIALQCSPFVQESRLSITLTSVAGPVDASGTISALARGRTIVTLRLFAQPPYVALTGMKDAAAPADYHEGDSGGYGNAIAAFATPAPDDTTIHVVYSCTPGTGSCATSNPPPLDAPSTLPWTNGNGLP
jgi:hypothetical protein